MNTHRNVISGTGMYVPPDVISNEELVNSFNAWVDSQGNPDLKKSSSEFIEKASGIRFRHVVDKKNCLDPNIMRPCIPHRGIEEGSFQVDFALPAARDALAQAGVAASEVNVVLVACSNFERPYPSLAIELQQRLGCKGFAFDLNVACSSMTFALRMADSLIQSGSARTVLVVSPELCSAHLNFRDRDSHFIFGDLAMAAVVQHPKHATASRLFEIVSVQLHTQYSTAIRNEGGFLNRFDEQWCHRPEMLFKQEGRQVFREVVTWVVQNIEAHLNSERMAASDIRRFWLHQANANMNALIAQKLLGRDPHADEAPMVLSEYGNTASAGSLVAFHLHRDDLTSGDLGLLCSFGAGYSCGSLLLRCL